jgi:hypothetical protein
MATGTGTFILEVMKEKWQALPESAGRTDAMYFFSPKDNDFIFILFLTKKYTR